MAAFDTNYPTGGNFEGTENYREALNAVAEVTQTIYFLNKDEALMFKRLDRGGAPVHTITKDDYYELDSGETRVLAAITNTNELGDSTSVEVDGITGVVQYVRNNPFWELRDDIQILLNHAGSAIGGIAATPFYCDWDGNFLLQIGDKIAITAEDNSKIISYLLNDTIRYDGILAEATQFIHDGEDETASNPLSLGDALKQTYAKIDKQNKEIQLVVSETQANSQSIASLTLDVNGIKLAIDSLENATIGDFTKLTTRVAALELSDTEIKASVEENKTAVKAVETDLGTIATELGTTEATLGALQGTVSTNTNNISGLTTNITTLTGTVTTHETKIGELTTTTESISAKVTDVESSVTTLESGLTEANTKITANETAIGELNVSTEGISGKVTNLETTTTELTTTVETINGTVTEQGTTIAENSTKIGELTTTTESISASVTSLETTTTTLTTKTDTLEGNLQDLGTVVDNQETAITTNTENIAALQIRDNEISASVSSLDEKTQTQIGSLEESQVSLSEQISELKLTDSALTLDITNIQQNGVDRVTTTTGFTFNDDGLTIEKSGSEISTNIDEDGLSVFKNNDEVLTADNTGVKAQNLHATTYLIIGANTYFSDYTAEDGEARAGCFWTGK